MHLNRHQIAVAKHVANGRSIKEAAWAMHISPKTVEYHFDKACKRLGITGVRMVNLTRWAIRNKLVRLCVVLLGMLMLDGCATQPIAKQMPPMPPMPPKRHAAPDAKYAGAIMRSITLSWNNYGGTDPRWVTGIEGSTNLAEWYELTNLPYSSSVEVTLYSRPNPEFYRAFNRIK